MSFLFLENKDVRICLAKHRTTTVQLPITKSTQPGLGVVMAASSTESSSFHNVVNVKDINAER